jgi:RNA polymerase sigma-70 factor, ECF subfamily
VSAVAAESPAASHEAYAERLYERHHRAIFGFCLKQLRRREDADDAVQTTFIYALLSLRRGIVPQMELPWLLTIARNVCSTRRRSGMRRGAYETPQDLDSLQDTLASPDRSAGATADELRAALSSLPESQRKALLLREWRGLSYDEIGTELGLSQAATEALLFRARQNVAQRLGAGLKTLQGLPALSFLRNLLQSAAAKTIAVGAGAALTVVTVPAADRELDRPAPRGPAIVHVDRATTTGRPTARPRGDVGTPAPHHAGVPPRKRSNSAAAAGPRRGAPVVSTVDPTPQPVAASAPTSHSPEPQPAATTTTPVDVTPAAPVEDPVQTVVGTASGVDTGSVVDQPLALPPVSVPQVTLPAVTPPVDLPTGPQVHLP